VCSSDLSVSPPVAVSTPKMTGLKLPLFTSRKLPLAVSDRVKGRTMSDVIGGPAELNDPLAEILKTDSDPLMSPVTQATKTKPEEAEAATAAGEPLAANGEPGTDAMVPSEEIVITFTLWALAKSAPMSVPIFDEA
jgi:hypothetical protein